MIYLHAIALIIHTFLTFVVIFWVADKAVDSHSILAFPLYITFSLSLIALWFIDIVWVLSSIAAY